MSTDTDTDIDGVSIAQRIVGAWELVEYSTTSDTGKVDYPLGPEARGLIIYSADGYMSAQIMRSGRTLYRTRNVHSGEMGERSEAAGGTSPIRVPTVSTRTTPLSGTRWRYRCIRTGSATTRSGTCASRVT